MVEECCYFNKEAVVKPARKSPPVLGRIVLLISAVSIAYIGLFCFRQTGFHGSHITARVELMEGACRHHRVPLTEIPYLHYPEPTTYNRNECGCAPVRFFAILSMQRSGSGWFETLLNSHVNISSNGEIFSVKERRRNISTIIETMDKVYNLDWYSSASKNECTAAAGFKWMLNQKLKEVQKFLGVPQRKLISRHVKIHTRPLSEQVANWGDIQSALQGTQYESFLNTDYEM